MNETDPRTQDQFTLTFTSNKLLLAICSLLMLMVLSVMLGIRIERFQQRQSTVLETRAGMLEAAPAAEPVEAEPVDPNVAATAAAVATLKPATKPAAPKPATVKRARTRAPKPAATTIAKAAPKPARPAPTRMSTENLSNTVPPPSPILLTKAASIPRLPARPKPTAARTAPTGMSASRARKFVVQVVSSRDRNQADLRARLLSVQGIPAFVESADLGNKGVWHRVLAGTFASKTEAKAILAKLQTDPQFSASFVRPY